MREGETRVARDRLLEIIDRELQAGLPVARQGIDALVVEQMGRLVPGTADHRGNGWRARAALDQQCAGTHRGDEQYEPDPTGPPPGPLGRNDPRRGRSCCVARRRRCFQPIAYDDLGDESIALAWHGGDEAV